MTIFGDVRSFAMLSAAVFIGCSGNDDPAEKSTETVNGNEPPVDVLEELEILPTPEGGVALYTPIIKGIEPGADETYCTFTDVITDEEMFVHTTNGSQSSMGHHGILYYTTEHQPPGTDLCYGRSMETMVQLLGGTGGEGTSGYVPPENAGMVIPKGAQLVVQTHWINYSTEPVDVQAMMVTVPGSNSADRIELGTMTVVDLTFEVAPMSPGESFVDCVFDKDHELLMHIGHEHEWGSHVRAELTRKSGMKEVLFDRDFEPSHVFEPPTDSYPIDDPLVILAGDSLRMSCEWNNDTPDPLTFPREMCVFFSYSMVKGDARCINGAWIGAGSGGTVIEGPPCAEEGAPGNAVGVGKHCTKGGAECADNNGTSICLADYTEGEFGNFCTKLCEDDAACGEGASCVGSGGPAVCFPTSCLASLGGDAGAP